MKRLVGIFAALLLFISAWGFAPSAQASEAGLLSFQSSTIIGRVNTADAKRSELTKGKLDLNNSDVREFRQLKGFYPSLASKIIQNAPYDNVEDVLNISGLSESQTQRLQANIDKFIVTDVEASMNAGDDRYNPGLY